MVSIAPFLVIGGFVALIGGISYLAGLTEKKRTEAMTAFARDHGYVFEGTSPQLIDELASFKLFNRGQYRTAKNVMRGSKDPGAVRICDYQFITGFGQSHQMHQLTLRARHGRPPGVDAAARSPPAVDSERALQGALQHRQAAQAAQAAGEGRVALATR